MTRLDWVGIRLNQFEMCDTHENCLSRWKQCCSSWKQCWIKTTFTENMFFCWIQRNIPAQKSFIPHYVPLHKKRSGSNGNITIYTEYKTITTSPSPYVTKYVLDTTIQVTFDQLKKKKLTKMMQNLTNNVKNWLISYNRLSASTEIKRFSKSFHQKSLEI